MDREVHRFLDDIRYPLQRLTTVGTGGIARRQIVAARAKEPGGSETFGEDEGVNLPPAEGN